MSGRDVLRYLDIVLVLIVAIPALALGAPVFGYVMGAGGWIAQRIVQANEDRLTRRFAEPRQQLTAHLFEAFGRIWLLAGVIIIAGVAGHRSDGLTAALVIFGAYSIAFGIRVMNGPPVIGPARAGAGTGGRSTALSRSGAGNRRSSGR